MARTAQAATTSKRTGGTQRATATGSSPRSAPASRKPVRSKDELRAQVEKLERENANLRAKTRELRRAAKNADARMAELEGELARTQGQSKRETERKLAQRRGRTSERDPGDAVPSGVAVQEPEPISEGDREVMEQLSEKLGSPSRP
jgi:chromosome segregation ATPase